MRVKDLIEKLQQQNPEAVVVVRGYEGGFNQVGDIQAINIEADKEYRWGSCYGEYKFAEIDGEQAIMID
jgi:hypothetical protein